MLWEDSAKRDVGKSFNIKDWERYLENGALGVF
jgi:hypothetical protein